MKKIKNLNFLAVILLFVGLGVGFFAGMKYQSGKATTQNSRQFTNGRGQFGQRNGMRPVAGEILSSDSNSITVKLADGSSKIVLLSDKTQINKAETASVSDLKSGERVAIFGTENSDGSITAQNIQLNPQFRNSAGSASASPR